MLIHHQSQVTKDVCVFCATRLQFAATRPASGLHRRFFKSTASIQRPPGTVVAQYKEETNQDADIGWRSGSLAKASGGSWAPAAAPRDLTPEEQALRNALKSTSQAPEIQVVAAKSPTRKFAAWGNKQSHQPQQARNGVPQAGHRISQSRLPHQHTQRDGGRVTRADATKSSSEGRNSPHKNSEWSYLHRNNNRQQPNSRQKSAQTSRVEYDNIQDTDALFSGPRWTCPSCRFGNSGENAICQRCHRATSPINKTESKAVGTYESDHSRGPQFVRRHSPSRGSEMGKWHCPNCRLDNFSEYQYCMTCETPRPLVKPREGDDEDVRAEGWKHLRRRGSRADPQQDHLAEAELSTDNENVTKAEHERMARMERTKDGRFVGLSQRNRASRPNTSEAMSNSQRQPNIPSSNQTRTKQFASSKSKVDDGWAQWQPSTSSIRQSADRPASREVSQVSKSADALEGWEYPAELTAEAGTFTHRHNVMGGEERKAQSSIRKHISFDPEFDADHQPGKTENLRTRESKPRRRDSGIEATSVPMSLSRYKQRKSKKFVSAIDEFDDDDDLHAERRSQRKKQREKAKVAQKVGVPPTPIYLPEFISVSNLAGVLRVRVEDFLHKMKDLGFEETNNDHILDAETAGLVAAEFNFEPIIERIEDQDLVALPPAEDKSILPARPPVVTIMGHVDHGKTTLLDYLRKSSVAASEHGGITQHIGAFSVPMPGGRLVTFLDTPGHEAFLSMRQRGANVTDIVILVVAADDSVKPQTIEAIKHAQAAKVPMIVAVNKIDKEDSDVQRVKQDLARYGVEIEDYGGDTQVVCVSGKTGQGMEELEDAAVALADILDMRAEVNGQTEGWVLEATTKKAGRVATILVRRGTLRPGDFIVAGTSWARVRSLRNEAGAMVPSAGPGTPVEVDGWREQPAAGDEAIQAPDEQKAKSVISYRLEASNRKKMAADMEAVNETRRLEQEKREQLEKAAALAETNPNAPTASSQTQTPPTSSPALQEVFFIVKADVSGSVEAVTNSVSALGNSEVHPHILRSGVGPVTEFDVDHAAVAKGHIINFNTVVEGQILRMAESKDVSIINQSIIYRLVDDVKAKLGEKLPSVTTQRVLGEAEIAQIFEINTKGRVTVPVAGCKVRNGVISKTAKIRVLRDTEVVFDGMFHPLHHISVYSLI